tara:strand:+ start:691 stop:1308 length:618 start_codon:yes stop_codon:yes gene_type:complete
MSEPRIEPIFGTPIYYNEVDNYEKIQQDFDEVIEATRDGDLGGRSQIQFRIHPEYGQTHYLSDPNSQEHLFERFALDNFREEINRNLKLYCASLQFEWRPYTINSSWIALFKNGNFGHCHHHGSADISGVYYLKKGDLDADDGHIYFKSPLVQAQTSLCYFGGKIVIPAKQGGLLLFPGWLEHGVNMNNSDEDRISVSFDVTFNR